MGGWAGTITNQTIAHARHLQLWVKLANVSRHKRPEYPRHKRTKISRHKRPPHNCLFSEGYNKRLRIKYRSSNPSISPLPNRLPKWWIENIWNKNPVWTKPPDANIGDKRLTAIDDWLLVFLGDSHQHQQWCQRIAIRKKLRNVFKEVLYLNNEGQQTIEMGDRRLGVIITLLKSWGGGEYTY